MLNKLLRIASVGYWIDPLAHMHQSRKGNGVVVAVDDVGSIQRLKRAGIECGRPTWIETHNCWVVLVPNEDAARRAAKILGRTYKP